MSVSSSSRLSSLSVDMQSLERRLESLELLIYRDMCSLIADVDVLQLRNSLVSLVPILLYLEAPQNKRRITARKIETSLSNLDLSLSRDRGQICRRLKRALTRVVLCDLLRKLISADGVYIEEALRLISDCGLNRGTSALRLSGFTDLQVAENRVWLLAKLRTFLTEIFVPLQMFHSSGSNLMEGIRLLSLMISRDQLRFQTCLDCGTDINCRFLSKVGLLNGCLV